MGLPIHGSQNMNHIRLMNKFDYVKARYDYLLNLIYNRPRRNSYYDGRSMNMRRYGQSAKNFDTNTFYNSKCLKQRAKNNNNNHISSRYKRGNIINANVHKSSLSLPLKSTSSYHSQIYHKMHKQKLTHLRKAFPIISNMPFIHLNSSLILINSSPFALTDRRFGILHHHSPSVSYY
jgi:hypothetical protein